MKKMCFSMTSILLCLPLTGYLLFPPGQLFILQIPIQFDLLCFVCSDLPARGLNLGTSVPGPTLLTRMHKNQYGKKYTNKGII